MSGGAGRHPSDADRERGAIDVLRRALEAARAGDRPALVGCYAEDVVWLERDGRRQGAQAAVDAHLALGAGLEWDEPQQQGARAALRWTRHESTGEGPDRGAVIVEVRRGRIVFAAAAP